jgi:hypothetical protein
MSLLRQNMIRTSYKIQFPFGKAEEVLGSIRQGAFEAASR